MATSIFKFGGSTFLELADYQRIAAYLHERVVASECKLVVVVSAMAGFTERLRGLAARLHRDPSAEACDALLTQADTLSTNLLRIAVEETGLKVTSLNGFQLGIRSDNNHARARVLDVDPGPLHEALSRVDVVVVPGGQAIEQHGRPTMLGKNSSDLTAILLAAALGESECEIFSDVCGVYTADPNLVPEARVCPEIGFEALIELASSGAKVLHPRAVRAARDGGVRIVCRANRVDYRIGTVVGGDARPRAVVIDHRSQVLGFAGDAVRTVAEERLRSIDIPIVEAQYMGRTVVVVIGGFFDATGFLGRTGLHAELLDAHLVSVFDGDGTPIRVIVPRAEAIDVGRTWHARFHGDGEAGGMQPSSVFAPATGSDQQALLEPFFSGPAAAE